MKLKRSSYYPCYCHILIFILSYLWNGTDTELVPGFSISVPRHVTVQRGLCVYIPCRFFVPKAVTLTRSAQGIWYKVETGTAVAVKSYNWIWNNGRFLLAGDIWRGDCSLYIEDPLYGDEGNYRFRVEDGETKFSYLDTQPYIEVTVLIDKPEMSPIKSWLVGDVVTLSCTAPGPCIQTAPQFTWLGYIGRVENRVITHANTTKTHISTISFTARREHAGVTSKCTVQMRGVLTTAQQITLNVEYPPEKTDIKCFIYNKEPSIHSSSNCTKDANNAIYPPEGSKLSLTCSADSLPESSLVWKYANESQINSSMGELIFTKVSLSHEGLYTCQASNVWGTTKTSVTIKIISQSMPNAFPVAAILGGCFAAVLIGIVVVFVIFYRRRKMAQINENSKQTHVNVIDPIYGNTEIFFNGSHGVVQTPKTDHQPNPGSENQNSQDLQYSSVNFSKLKANVPADAEKVEYSVIKLRK